ncbi:hypothetical protein BLL52_3274 [Rhodoferax antarcticus ANT.BR]|uniref:Uncharacterized protein n=1 Tax=Rhodoferax antarcticus ANT.BR TaxID=1111071 RepID=A0A1Q8YC31_9BURK|nr:hypothetical protein BLL52_3274 [Rhodoferax antarcticus ANT.BR]
MGQCEDQATAQDIKVRRGLNPHPTLCERISVAPTLAYGSCTGEAVISKIL